jgi:aspartate/methionine/tyrosine aminotransferase
VRTRPEDGFRLDPLSLKDVGAFLLSNPCNPTGAVLHGPALAALVATARERGCGLLLDEFYSHYTYGIGGPVSAASHVDDPDADQVLLFDGLTKNFRYPGWRVGWVVGPADAIGTLDRVGSALDGGPSQIAQRAALAALEPSYADAETAAVRKEFARKRDLMVDALRDMGIQVSPPDGTFYVWGRLPGDAMDFFSRALDQGVITVPGHLFDVNPGKRRSTPSYRDWMRFSFGPPYAQVEEGLSRLAKICG